MVSKKEIQNRIEFLEIHLSNERKLYEVSKFEQVHIRILEIQRRINLLLWVLGKEEKY